MSISVSKGIVIFFAMKYLGFFLLVHIFCSELNATEFLENKTEGNRCNNSVTFIVQSSFTLSI